LIAIMELQLPAWFKYRQGEAAPAGDKCFKLTAPVSAEAYIRTRQQDEKWLAEIASAPDAPAIAATEPKFQDEADAWRAAFELYRATVIY
jgi:hypothetical protein